MRPIIEDSFTKHSNKNHTSSEPPRMPTVQKIAVPPDSLTFNPNP
jgi:hypothetical protein